MKRLTSNNVHEMNMTELALNQVSVESGQAWYLLDPPEDGCSVCDLIRKAATAGLELEGNDLSLSLMTDEELGDVMLDWLQFGEKEPEGILAILYRALWAMAELRERLKLYEDICFATDGTELLTPELLQEAQAGLKNDPLTLEELREISWEPVWIEGDCETELGHNGWAIISQHKSKKYVCVWWPGEDCADIPSLDNYSNTWLVYRRKPEESANAD